MSEPVTKIETFIDSLLYTRIKSRLVYDGLKTSVFIKKMFDYYLENDPDLSKVILKMKLEVGKERKVRAIKSDKLIQQGEQNKKVFNLNNEEIKGLYDILELDDE